MKPSKSRTWIQNGMRFFTHPYPYQLVPIKWDTRGLREILQSILYLAEITNLPVNIKGRIIYKLSIQYSRFCNRQYYTLRHTILGYMSKTNLKVLVSSLNLEPFPFLPMSPLPPSPSTQDICLHPYGSTWALRWYTQPKLNESICSSISSNNSSAIM